MSIDYQVFWLILQRAAWKPGQRRGTLLNYWNNLQWRFLKSGNPSNSTTSPSSTPAKRTDHPGARASRPHPCGSKNIDPLRRCRPIQVAEMAEVVPSFVRAGRPRSRVVPLPNPWRIPLEPRPIPSWPFVVLRVTSWITLFTPLATSASPPNQSPNFRSAASPRRTPWPPPPTPCRPGRPGGRLPGPGSWGPPSRRLRAGCGG